MDGWMKEFRRHQPDVRKGDVWEHVGNSLAMPALYSGAADIAPMGREVLPYEMVPYEKKWKAKRPLEIRIARGAHSTGTKSPAQAIYVHKDNPLTRISKPQLDAVLGSERRLGHPENVTRWGQLGLTGEWAARPVKVYMPLRTQASAVYMRKAALADGAWRCGVVEASPSETVKAIARDPSAIGFGNIEDGVPGVRMLAVAEQEGGEAFEPSVQNVAAGRYPLTPYVYMEVNRRPGEPVPPHVKEFLRFILSQEGQRLVALDAFFPLSPAEVNAELAKLE
jgi:ABC-type phosphate transport system substrate-binding protein